MSESTPEADAVERLPSLSQATVSPDGSKVAFYDTQTGQPEIHVLDLATTECEQRTAGAAGETTIWPLAWFGDTERVLYHRDDGDGTEQYDVYAVGADTAPEPVIQTDGSTQLRDVGPQGSTVLVRSNHEGGMDAYLYNTQSGELTRLTDRDHPVYRPVLSSQGDRIAYPADGALHVCDTAGDRVRTLDVGQAETTVTPVEWRSEADQILIESDASGVTQCGVYDTARETVTWFGDGEYVEEPECFLPDGRFVALRTRDALTRPVVYSIETGESRELSLPTGVTTFGRRADRVVAADELLLTHTTPRRPGELLVYDLDTDSYETVFERDLGPFEPSDFAPVDYDRIPSGGVPNTAQAAVAHEPGESFDIGTLFWDAGVRPSPLVVYPHGGPHESSRRTFQPHVQYLCQQGYSVLQVNYRGSSGRSRAFRRALYGDWGGPEQGDIATAVEHALSTYEFLDPDRVAVYGGSFGGYAAYWQLVQYPDLYDAGAAIVGMTDLGDMYANTVPRFRSGFMQRHLGHPDEHEDLYRQRSPVTHATNLDAPLLIVHGKNDPRVPVSQARRFRDALIDAGYAEGPAADFEYHELPESGHWDTSHGVPESLALVDEFLGRRF